MQIVEANDLWVRVVELRVERSATPLRFVLYPMLHVGAPSFYQEIQRRLAAVEVAVVEGVGRSRAVTGLTRGSSAIARDATLGLTLQRIDHDAIAAQVICPDMTGPEFEARWRTVPRWQRGLTQAISRSLPAAQRLLGPSWVRETLQDVSLDDLPTSDEPDPEWIAEIDRVVVDERDVLLVEALFELHERRSREPITVAVVYGARHMRAVTTALTRRYGYKVRAGDWAQGRSVKWSTWSRRTTAKSVTSRVAISWMPRRSATAMVEASCGPGHRRGAGIRRSTVHRSSRGPSATRPRDRHSRTRR